MPIVRAHSVLYTPEPEALRAVLRDVLGWQYIDAGDGWLIFDLPPGEIGVHPSEGSTQHEFALVAEDIHGTIAELRAKGLDFDGDAKDLGFGVGATLLLPGGVRVLLYEPSY